MYNIFGILLGLCFVGFMFYKFDVFKEKINLDELLNNLIKKDKSGFISKNASKSYMFLEQEIKLASGADEVNEELKKLNEDNIPIKYLWK